MMTQEDFAKVVDSLKSSNAFLCAADVDEQLATAMGGSPKAIIVAAIKIINDAAGCTDDKKNMLFWAISMLQTAMILESKDKEEEQK